MFSGHASQGASTITQQLARNFFLSPEKTLMRKVKEAFLAIRIEQLLNKDEILELYLNKSILAIAPTASARPRRSTLANPSISLR